MEHFDRYNNLPVIGPDWDDTPWFICFSTVSYVDGEAQNYKKDNCEENRRALNRLIKIDNVEWITLNHGNNVITVPPEKKPCRLNDGSDSLSEEDESEFADTSKIDDPSEFADAAIVAAKGYGAAITTADCLPVVLVSPWSDTIAIVHAGWKGVVNGVVEKTINEMSFYKDFVLKDLRIWIGPSVRDDYEIREDVRSELLNSPNVSESHFVAINDEQYLVDLPGILIEKLEAIGIERSQVEVCPESTIKSERFFSVRREGADTGRFATIVAIRDSVSRGDSK